MNTITTTAAYIEELTDRIETTRTRSAWDRGVKAYALELLEDLRENLSYYSLEEFASPRIFGKCLLNGAHNWYEYSWGGCSYIYSEDIARRLCTPSELRRLDNGHRLPNSREEWLDTQGRALRQAAYLIERIAAEIRPMICTETEEEAAAQ